MNEKKKYRGEGPKELEVDKVTIRFCGIDSKKVELEDREGSVRVMDDNHDKVVKGGEGG